MHRINAYIKMKPYSQYDKSNESIEEAYYKDLFINNPNWSSKYPNQDETARWNKINQCILKILTSGKNTNKEEIRFLDVGCGRGWLTNLLFSHGYAEGVEPVLSVVEYARNLFPQIKFTAGTLEDIIKNDNYHKFDIIVCSEVIEHISNSEKSNFINLIHHALKPNGHVIISTPRKEVLLDLLLRSKNPNQPIEDWLSEPELLRYFLNAGFKEIGRAHV